MSETVFRHKVVRYKVPWHGVWLIVLQLFPHIAYTATSILRCPQLPDQDGQISSVSIPVRVVLYECRFMMVLYRDGLSMAQSHALPTDILGYLC